jgi:ribonuclease E
MPKKMLIDATHAEETRVVVVDGNKVEEFDFESENKRQLAGNIYLAKVTRVEPSLQAAFVDYGGNRHGFLAFSEIHPDYYQIPVADREALLEEERAYAEAMAAEEDEREDKKKSRSRSRGRSRSRSRSKAVETRTDDAVATAEAEIEADGNGEAQAPESMEVIDLGADEGMDAHEAESPMERVEETPVEEPADAGATAGEGAESDAFEDDADEENHDEDDEHDDTAIESVAEEDVTEEIRQPRKPRPKKYKIQEVVKVRQIMLVQVVKEERGNKGAALTTYLSLAGRYCVLMPNTARGGGISRKITNAVDRKKLKEIAGEIDVPKGAGLIVRTAGAKRTKAEIKRDYEYLQRLWEEIRTLTLKSIAPAKIYEEGNLIKRSIRDLYNRDIDEVLVEGDEGYRVAKDFMKMIMPSHAKNVKHYTESLPLLARFQVESYLSSMFNPTVQLKSGGYIVIGVTEALVAIDVNSGRATKEGSIEETALKTNLEAAEEVARQLRLRDLAGLIVIDFIDMEERKNNAAVEKRMKDKLKTDRARIQVGRISGFGLMEMSRQRLRPGMIEATTQPCPHCHGTGLVRSDDNLALNILRQLEEEGTRRRSREVLLKAPVAIVNYLVNHKREHIAQIEQRYGMGIRLEADAFLISPDFEIEKFKTATRAVPEVAAPVVSANAALMEDLDEVVEDEIDEVVEAEETPESPEGTEGDEGTKKKRRRRRRRPRSKTSTGENGENGENGAGTDEAAQDEAAAEPVAEEAPVEAEAEVVAEAEPEEKPKPARTSRSSSSRSRSRKKVEPVAEEAAGEAQAEAEAEPAAKPAPKRKPPTRSRAKKPAAPADEAKADTPQADAAEDATEEKPAKKPATRSRAKKKPDAAPAEAEPVVEAAPKAEPAPAPAPEPAAAPANDDAAQDDGAAKKKGWWSLGR